MHWDLNPYLIHVFLNIVSFSSFLWSHQRINVAYLTEKHGAQWKFSWVTDEQCYSLNPAKKPQVSEVRGVPSVMRKKRRRNNEPTF